MSETPDLGGVEEDLAEEDMGEPVEELRMLAEDPTGGFLARLRGAIRRRDLSAQIAGLGWGGLGTVFMEFLEIVFSVFDTTHRDEGGQR